MTKIQNNKPESLQKFNIRRRHSGMFLAGIQESRPGIPSKNLDRSLPLVVYTPRGGTEKSALKGCLPPAFAGMTTFCEADKDIRV